MTSKKNFSLIIKDLIFTGLIATVLLIPIVGFRTEISTTDSTGLIFNYNFIIAFLVLGFIVGVRLLFHIYWFSKIQRKPKEDSEENKKIIPAIKRAKDSQKTACVNVKCKGVISPIVAATSDKRDKASIE